MKKYKLVFIGNSIVKGFPHRRSQCFASLVREEMGMEVINKGENGQTTEEILERFGRDVIDHAPDAAFIMTGTNDFIYGRASAPECMENLRHMAEMARDRGIIPILLTPILTEPQMAAALWMAGAGIDYEEVNRQLVLLASQMIDYGAESVTAVMDLQAAFISYEERVGATVAYHDGVHPTVEGQRVLFECVREKIFKFM